MIGQRQGATSDGDGRKSEIWKFEGLESLIVGADLIRLGGYLPGLGFFLDTRMMGHRWGHVRQFAVSILLEAWQSTGGGTKGIPASTVPSLCVDTDHG